VKKVFTRARENAPSVLFFDEIDAIASRRAGASEKSRRLLAQLLIEMDGLRNCGRVVVLAATNRPSDLDPALLRPGRFDKVVYVPPPTREARAELFRRELSGVSEGLDYEKLAEVTRGFSAADIIYICNEAKMRAAKRTLAGGDPRVGMEDVLEVVDSTKPSLSDEMLAEYYKFYQRHARQVPFTLSRTGSGS